MPRPTVAAVAILAGALIGVPPAAAQNVTDESYRAPDGTRVLRQSIVVPASPEELWPLFTTSEGIMSWAVPVARVDFRLGGTWESSYDIAARPGDPGNILNRYLAHLPYRMIAIQAERAPPGFPHPELLDELFSVIEFVPVPGGGTLVTVSGVGYGDGEAWDVIHGHFSAGNRWTLEQLHGRVTRGPVDWSAGGR